MAIFIVKVVCSSACSSVAGRGDRLYRSSSYKSNPTGYLTSCTAVSGGSFLPKLGNVYWGNSVKNVETRGGSSGLEIYLAIYPGKYGIKKTVEAMVVADSGKDSYSNKL